ncbi:MAG: bacterial regulatory helix-turn-helix, lysR family protein [Gammaproteobacteria bacterium]|jgi:DNA-binding transcriptional LysR family regulator|nr:bacterial regulatory helix-turn-helix, lysR family protein [Gammaproteobacteria bacterium]
MIEAIRYFLTVKNEGNFARAAWVLNLAPSVITKKVKVLENELGYKLFYRTTRRVTLTPEGQVFAAEAESLVKNYDHLFTELSNGKAPIKVIKIASNLILAKLFVTKFLAEFLNQHPNIHIEFLQESSPLKIADGTVEIVIGHSSHDLPHLNKTPLLLSCRRLYASPAYLAQRGTPKTPQDLLNHDCLINLATHPDRKWIFDNKEITLHPKITAHDGALLVSLAIENAGIINMAEEAVLDYVRQGKLVPLDMKVKGQTSSLYLFYAKHPKEHIVRKFVDFLEKKLKQDFSPKI